MPMVPAAVYAMLACARIGAVHSIVFGGFSADSYLAEFIDCNSEFIITADQGVRGKKSIPLKVQLMKHYNHVHLLKNVLCLNILALM